MNKKHDCYLYSNVTEGEEEGDWKRRQISQRPLKTWKPQHFDNPQTVCHAKKMNQKRSLRVLDWP